MQNFLKSYRNASDIEYQALRASSEFQHLLFEECHTVLDDLPIDLPVASWIPTVSSNIRVINHKTSVWVQVDSLFLSQQPNKSYQYSIDSTDLNNFTTMSTIWNNVKKKVTDDVANST